jgi:acyl-CoA synthetase (AMP-forming)/AMP-acid ligase II
VRADGKDSIVLSGLTLGDALRNIVDTAPQTSIVFPQRQHTVTVTDLLSSAEDSARAFLSAGVGPQEVVGLLGMAGPELLTAIFGITLAGAAVSVLPTPTDIGGMERHLRHLTSIASRAQMRHIVVDTRNAELGRRLGGAYPQARVLPATLEPGGTRHLPSTGPDDVAVVQFTSGSTSQPRGVVLTHRMVLAGLRAITLSAGFTPNDVFIQWVPHHHDMGLFGHLAQILNGVPSHVFEPRFFIRRPEEFLRYLAASRATVVTGPNFAYDLLTRVATPELVNSLDLSSWRLAFNGAEPVSAATVRGFSAAFGAAGVAPTVMYPVYGLAEATLAVAFPRPGAEPRVVAVDRAELSSSHQVIPVSEHSPGAKLLVSVGGPVAGAEIRVVDGQGRALGPGQLGEMQIKGQMVTSGYLGDQETTKCLFDHGWLSTGDLAFQLDGDYFIAGRRKEMTVVRGKNYFPDDAETAARQVTGVYRGNCVAVADTDPYGQESIALIVETGLLGHEAIALEREVVQTVITALGMPHVHVHTVPPRWLTRTTSGKWQRLLAAERLRRGE